MKVRLCECWHGDPEIRCAVRGVVVISIDVGDFVYCRRCAMDHRGLSEADLWDVACVAIWKRLRRRKRPIESDSLYRAAREARQLARKEKR